jgi:putative ABC transport system permease protein
VIVPSRSIRAEVFHRRKKLDANVIGTVPWYPEISPLRIKYGRFITSIDTHYKQAVCVIDEFVRKELFAFDDPLGQNVKIGGDYYRVIGISTAQKECLRQF